MKFTQSFNHTHKEAVCEESVGLVAGMKGTVVALITEASHKAQMIHNAQVQKVETEEISADEMWLFVEKNRKTGKRRK